MKKLVFLLFLSSFLLFFYYARSGNFRVSKVFFPLNEENGLSQEPFLLPLGEKPEVFTYLGKGRQSYVFENKKLELVLKIFRGHKYFCPLTLRLKDSLGLLSSKDQQFLAEQKERKERAFLSYHLARTKLFSLTHVTYLRTIPCQEIKGKIILTDRWGLFRQKIALEDFGFLIQKRGEALEPILVKAVNNHDEKKIKELLNLYGQAVQKRIEQKIANRDFQNGLRNAGLYHQQVMEMDVGSFCPLSTDPKEEVERSFESFQTFFKKLYPEALFLIKESKQKLLNHLNLENS